MLILHIQNLNPKQIMKILLRSLLPLLLCISAIQVNAQHSLTKLWETDSVVAVPESVLPVGKILVVSEIDGEPWGRDGKAEVGKIARDGKVIDLNWITGLNAPKGLALNGDLLYVADLDELVVISVSKGKIDHK